MSEQTEIKKSLGNETRPTREQSREEMRGHTPGPWTESHNHGELRLTDHSRIFMHGSGAAAVYSMGCTAEESEANARLIAAAPDLLEVCQRLAAFWDVPSGPGMDWKRKEERTAIAIQMSRAISKAEKGN